MKIGSGGRFAAASPGDPHAISDARAIAFNVGEKTRPFVEIDKCKEIEASDHLSRGPAQW